MIRSIQVKDVCSHLADSPHKNHLVSKLTNEEEISNTKDVYRSHVGDTSRISFMTGFLWSFYLYTVPF